MQIFDEFDTEEYADETLRIELIDIFGDTSIYLFEVTFDTEYKKEKLIEESTEELT